MGKTLLVLLALGMSGNALAGVHLQTALPSDTKKVRVSHSRKKPLVNRAPAEEERPENNPFVSDDPFTTRVVSRTVHFWHSTARLPRSYRCDEDINGQKILEAETKAMAECQARGLDSCHVQKVRIVKSGALKCADLIGNSCRPREYYAGCVAEAVVLGKN